MTVRKVDYDDNDSLVEALKGQEAVVIALAFTAPPEIQTRIIDAAAEAKVPFVIPNEYGSDNANVALREAVPMNAAKTKYRNRVEELGVSSWIAIVCNPWYDHVSKRTCRIIDRRIDTKIHLVPSGGLLQHRRQQEGGHCI